MPSIDSVKQQKRSIIGRYCTPNDLRGLSQVAVTLLPLALLWWLAVQGAALSLWVSVAATLMISLFTLRAFALMHDCGHGCLFKTARYNRAVGFLLGVLTGMPQYVWSQHHNFHHTHNGNWDKYRGPYATRTTDEYAAMSGPQQRYYRAKCSLGAAPIAGFVYLVFNPRFTWLKGTVGLALHVLRRTLADPRTPWRAHSATFQTCYWQSPTEYRHMAWNNLALLTLWALMSWACGPLAFFAIYVAAISLAGAAGIVLFTVQHNFDHAYASGSDGWDYDTAAIRGTSLLLLPAWLNWFTVDIAYHHVHHLSANIPNYRLAACHREFAHLFGDVTRVPLAGVPGALHCILWDKPARQIIRLDEYLTRA